MKTTIQEQQVEIDLDQVNYDLANGDIIFLSTIFLPDMFGYLLERDKKHGTSHLKCVISEMLANFEDDIRDRFIKAIEERMEL